MPSRNPTSNINSLVAFPSFLSRHWQSIFSPCLFSSSSAQATVHFPVDRSALLENRHKLPLSFSSSSLDKMKSFVAVLCFVASAALADPEVRASGLQVEYVSKPDSCEKEAKNGNLLTMHYTGTLQSDGTKFDSSLDRSEPFKFQIGVGQVRIINTLW